MSRHHTSSHVTGLHHGVLEDAGEGEGQRDLPEHGRHVIARVDLEPSQGTTPPCSRAHVTHCIHAQHQGSSTACDDAIVSSRVLDNGVKLAGPKRGGLE